MTTTGWLLVLIVVGILGAALAYGRRQSQSASSDVDMHRRQDEATRRLYDDPAKRPPD